MTATSAFGIMQGFHPYKASLGLPACVLSWHDAAPMAQLISAAWYIAQQ